MPFLIPKSRTVINEDHSFLAIVLKQWNALPDNVTDTEFFYEVFVDIAFHPELCEHVNTFLKLCEDLNILKIL